MKFTSNPYSSVSGSIAGTTYYSRQGGLIARARVTPSNPNSDAQQEARQALAATASAWNLLTAADKQLWDDYAQLTPTLDKLGGTIYLTGQQMFSKWAAPSIRIAQNVDLSPPAGTAGLGAPPVAISGAATGSIWSVSFAAGGASADGNLYIRASAVLGVSQRSTHYPLTFDAFNSVAADDTSVQVTSTKTLEATQRYVVAARVLYDTGQVSTPLVSVVQVTGGPP